MAMEIITGIFTVFGIIITIGIGLLYAFFPMNDKETSTLHRVLTLFVTILIVALWI